jgi:hypothetical protein
MVAASMTAKPATGSAERMNGPPCVSTPLTSRAGRTEVEPGQPGRVNPSMSVSINPGGTGIEHDGGMTSESWHISERIGRPADEVYAYASDPANVPRWAPGLGNSVAEVDGQWFVDTPTERVRLAFAPRNDLGVLDHYLTLDSGEVSYVPVRVIADEGGSEVIFTVRRRPDMTDDEFKADGDAVAADLARLKRILEE